MSVDLIVRRVQVLMEDVAGLWCDADYVLGKLAICNEDLESFLEAIGLTFEDAIVTLLNVPAGTTDLSAYQAEGQPLAQLMSMDKLEWRTVGATDLGWQQVFREDKLDDTVPGGAPSITGYTFRLGLVQITPPSIAVDLRVGFTMLPDALVADSDSYIKGMTNVLVYRTAELIATNRNVAKSTQAAFYAAKAMKAEDNVMAILVKAEQQTPRRAGGRRTKFQTSFVGRTQFQ